MHSISPIDPDDPTWPDYPTPVPPPAPAPAPAPSPSAGQMVAVRTSRSRSVPHIAPRMLLGLSQLVGIGVGIVEVGLLLRIVLLLLAANPTAGFSTWVYGLTGPLVAPFAGVFPELTIVDSVLDAPAILALIVYGLAGRIVESILHLLARL